MAVVITSVTPKSPAAKAGVKAGETLAAINGHEINDALDYGFYCYERTLTLDLVTRTVKVRKKDDYDDIGLNFETYLMDKKHSCHNKCIFCFIDQLPPNMRETLYFKDDDSRLSFLQGSYITSTFRYIPPTPNCGKKCSATASRAMFCDTLNKWRTAG